MDRYDAMALIDRAQASMRDFLEYKISSEEHERERNRLRDKIVAETKVDHIPLQVESRDLNETT